MDKQKYKMFTAPEFPDPSAGILEPINRNFFTQSGIKNFSKRYMNSDLGQFYSW